MFVEERTLGLSLQEVLERLLRNVHEAVHRARLKLDLQRPTLQAVAD